MTYASVGLPYGNVKIKEAILTSGLSKGGDSGSTILGYENKKRENPTEILGILLGGGANHTYSFGVNINIVIHMIREHTGISLVFNF